jgi:hypothetical protein
MENENAPEGGDNNPNNGKPAAVEPQADFRAALDEGLSRIESSLLAKLSERQAPKKPEMTAAEYQQLLKDNPAAAIDLAVDRKVQEKLNPAIQRLTADQARTALDDKAHADFPALKTDSDFQKRVGAQMAEFVKSGEYDKDHPKLVYRAAELVALKQEAKSRTSTSGKGGMSGEAPNTTAKDSKANAKKPDNFATMASVFGMSKESQERMLAKQKAKGGG